MAETKLSFTKSLPPYIRSSDSLAKRFWGQGLALLPVFIAACLTAHAGVLRVLLICLVSAVAFDFLAAKLSGKKENLRCGETVLTAILFSLLVPMRCPSELVILGIFIAILLKELLGGTGAYPLQPMVLAGAILQLSFPVAMSGPMLLGGAANIWILVGTGLGGILLMNQRKGYWESPVLFTAVCFGIEASRGGQELAPAFLCGVIFTAFFLLADPVVLPLTRKGRVLLVLGAALLSSFLEPGGFSVRAAIFALLWMYLLTPWLEIWLKPVPYRSRPLIKATYPL